jgi:hypothetical protein
LKCWGIGCSGGSLKHGVQLKFWFRVSCPGGILGQVIQLRFWGRAFSWVSKKGIQLKLLGQGVPVQVGHCDRLFSSGGSLEQDVQLIFWAEFSDV